MAIVHTTVSQVPTSAQTQVSYSKLPVGTVWMFGWSFDYHNGEDSPYPYPVPEHHYTSFMKALDAACPLFNTKNEETRCIHLTPNGSFGIVEGVDGLLHKSVFIYIWAITPMGGAA